MARMLQARRHMTPMRAEITSIAARRRAAARDDTAPETVVRYAGFLTIAGAVALGEALVRIDELVSRAWAEHLGDLGMIGAPVATRSGPRAA
jgi:hypothetical protein